MKTRIITGCLIGILVIILIFSSVAVFNIAYIAASAVIMFELLHAGKTDISAYVVNILFTLLYVLSHIYMPQSQTYILPVYLLTIFTVHIFRYSNFSVNKLFYSVFTFVYVNMLLSYLADIKYFVNYGSYMLLMFVVTVVFSDSGAYFIGVTIGKHKLCPKISPKKTIEGSMGAFLGAIVSAIVMAIIYNSINIPVSYVWSIVYGIVCGGVSQIGDLLASSIKRYFEIKDYGDLLPGHGGIMDRLDSVILVAPVFYFFLVNFIYIG